MSGNLRERPWLKDDWTHIVFFFFSFFSLKETKKDGTKIFFVSSSCYRLSLESSKSISLHQAAFYRILPPPGISKMWNKMFGDKLDAKTTRLSWPLSRSFTTAKILDKYFSFFRVALKMLRGGDQLWWGTFWSASVWMRKKKEESWKWSFQSWWPSHPKKFSPVHFLLLLFLMLLLFRRHVRENENNNSSSNNNNNNCRQK